MGRRARNPGTTAGSGGLRLAITGGQTLVAARLLARLDEVGIREAVVFDIQAPDVDDPRIVFHQLDLTLPGADAEMADVMRDRGTTTLLHTAFLWNPVRDLNWAHELESVGTDYVLAAALSAGVRKVVMTSSVMVYGISHRNPVPLTEDHPLVPERVIPPFRDKVGAEHAFARFAAAHPEVCATVLRTAFALGSDTDRVIARLLSGPVVPTLMGFDPLFQFVHPDDVVEAYRRVLTEDHPGAFNITTPDVIALSDVLRVGGRTPLPIPHLLAQSAWRVLYAVGLGELHPSVLGVFRFPIVTDGTKARRQMGFVPARSTLDTVLEFYRRGGGE